MKWVTEQNIKIGSLECECGFEVGIDFNPLKKERVQNEYNREGKRDFF